VWFDALAGQKVRAVLSAGTFASNCDLQATFLRLDGTPFSDPACGGQSATLPWIRIRRDGIYKLRLAAGGHATGTVTVAIRSTRKISSITANARPIRVALNGTSPVRRFGFVARRGEAYTVNATQGTLPGCAAYRISILHPRRHVLSSSDACGRAAFIDQTVATTDGTYRVEVENVGGGTGGLDLALYKIADSFGSANLDGVSRTLRIGQHGQNPRFVIAATPGQKISVVASASTFIGCEALFLRLLRPDGSQQTEVGTCTSDAFLDATVLDEPGEWHVVVDPVGPSKGWVNVAFSNVVDQTGSIAPGGTAVGFSSSTPGKNARFTFSGTSGDSRTVTVTNSTFPGCSAFDVALVRPDGSILKQGGSCSARLTLGPSTLDATGTWTVLFDPAGAATGTAKVKLT
jgi:hypothetical protein